MKEFVGILVENKKITKKTYLLSFQIDIKFDFIPGQFLMIDVGKNLRRPFAIFDFDSKTKILSILVKENGSGTIKLIKTANGKKINILAPLGNGYDLNVENPILLSGGIGLASIYPLIKYFKKENKHFTSILGYKTKTEIPNFSEIKDAIIYTEDGSFGIKGFPTDYLNSNKKNNSTIYSCGPTPLVNALKKHTVNYDIFVSLEEKMACGVGACLSCVVETSTGLLRVCKDGPVFGLKNIR